MYKLNVRKGVKGEAWYVVPISENEVDRAVFNSCIRIVLGRKVRNSEEFKRVAEWKDKHEKDIMKALKQYGKMKINDEELNKLEDFVFEYLKDKLII